MILLVSCFRNSTSYIERYAEQAQRLRRILGVEPLHVIAVEGDSTDDTYELLCSDPAYDTVLKAEHGGQMFGSVVHPLRWRQLSVAGNAGLCAAQRMSRPGDRTVYVESDLVWEADMMEALIEDVTDMDAVAPMSMAGARFYDIWGHVKDGRGFSAHPPFYPGWDPDALPTRIDSAGSCFALTHDALQVAEFSAVDCIRGIGRSLRAAGYDLWVDPALKVEHP